MAQVCGLLSACFFMWAVRYGMCYLHGNGEEWKVSFLPVSSQCWLVLLCSSGLKMTSFPSNRLLLPSQGLVLKQCGDPAWLWAQSICWGESVEATTNILVGY